MNRFFHASAALAFITFSTPSLAQATRTWVSGVGDDANPCSRTAPCKTFAGAISKTASGGEIDCIDPGGFGAVTITKSMTIDCSGTFASILNVGTNGINVNDSATGSPGTIDVTLRGFAINGSASTGTGTTGINFVSGRSLVLENMLIENQKTVAGIVLKPSAVAEFYAENVTITNGNIGILMQPSGSGGVLRATLRNVRVQNNSGVGLRMDSNGNASNAGTVALIDKSNFSGNSDGILISTLGGTQSIAMVNDSLVMGNSNTGLSATGVSARMRVANTSVTINGTGISIGPNGVINSFGNNRVEGNVTNGAFTSPVLPEK